MVQTAYLAIFIAPFFAKISPFLGCGNELFLHFHNFGDYIYTHKYEILFISPGDFVGKQVAKKKSIKTSPCRCSKKKSEKCTELQQKNCIVFTLCFDEKGTKHILQQRMHFFLHFSDL